MKTNVAILSMVTSVCVSTRTFLIMVLLASIGFSTLARAESVSGQGTWETTLLARDLDGNPTTIEGYYDKVLNITWLANTTAAGTTMTWDDATNWAANLDIYGFSGWRLPLVYNTNGVSAYSGSSIGYNNPTTSGSPPYPAVSVYSEMATMFYDTLGNLAQYDTSGNPQSGYGLTNSGPFENLQSSDYAYSSGYWSGTVFSDVLAREFYFASGNQGVTGRSSLLNAWAVHDGDLGQGTNEDYWPSVTTDKTYLTDFITLGDTFSFDYFWEMGTEPTNFNFDALFFNGTEWETFGWQLNFSGSSTDWASASFYVPTWARGQSVQIKFSLFDLGQETDPTVYLRNIASTSAPVPEPSTLLLFGSGLAGFAAMGRKRRR